MVIMLTLPNGRFDHDSRFPTRLRRSLTPWLLDQLATGKVQVVPDVLPKLCLASRVLAQGNLHSLLKELRGCFFRHDLKLCTTVCEPEKEVRAESCCTAVSDSEQVKLIKI